MTIIANTQFPNLIPPNLEFTPLSTDGLFPTLGAELVYTQDSSGRYLHFHWDHSAYLGCDTERIVDFLNENDSFAPVDKVVYLEHLHRILSSSVPETVKCWFKCNIELFELELTITPILPQFGQPITTVLVMGRLLPSKINPHPVNQSVKPLTSIESILRSQQHQKLLTKISKNIRQILDLDVIWQKTVDSLGKTLKLKHCIICPCEPTSKKVRVIAEYLQPEETSILGSEIDISSEPAFAQALATLKPVVMVIADDHQSQQSKVMAVATYYQSQANSLLVLSFAHECSQLQPAELKLAQEVAEQIGTAIAHANLYKVVEKYQQKAEAAERLKSEFLSNISHEIRTPLNGIIGFLQLILAGMTDHPEEQNEFITEAHQLSLHLLNILNNILDAANIETGKIELDFSPVNLKDLFQHIEHLTRPQAEIKNLSFQMEILTISDKILVQGNYQRLLQVMLNLVGNAIKFTHQGGITVSADLIPHKHPATVKITVTDTGIGVSPDNQDKLFQLFSQVDGSRTRQYGGTGLGLVISQRLIQAMGGELHFYSLGEGFGSTVTFTIPVY